MKERRLRAAFLFIIDQVQIGVFTPISSSLTES
jgi:hypothetical protein